MKYFSVCPVVCPGVRESSQQVSQVRDSYSWVLNIPNKNLRMNFQEVNYPKKIVEDKKDWLYTGASFNNVWIAPLTVSVSFIQVLVDLSSKNDRGLYQARVRALVGGRPLTFYSLVGLENESFYRSVPRIIALALEALKTWFHRDSEVRWHEGKRDGDIQTQRDVSEKHLEILVAGSRRNKRKRTSET